MKIIWMNCKNGNRTFAQLYRGLVSLTLSSPKSVSVDSYSILLLFVFCHNIIVSFKDNILYPGKGRNNFDREWME